MQYVRCYYPKNQAEHLLIMKTVILIHILSSLLLEQVRNTHCSKMTSNQPFNTSTPADEQFDFLFKIVVIGDCGVGKTCVVQRFKSGMYIERHGNTIGVDFSMKTVNVDAKKVKVSLYSFIFVTCLFLFLFLFNFFFLFSFFYLFYFYFHKVVMVHSSRMCHKDAYANSSPQTCTAHHHDLASALLLAENLSTSYVFIVLLHIHSLEMIDLSCVEFAP